MRYYLALFAILLIGCTSSFQLKPEKVRPWSSHLAAEQPFHSAYVAVFQRKDARLSFLAAHHGNEINNSTMSLLRKLLVEDDYNFVFIEGIPFERGISPSSYLDYARSSVHADFIEGGEPAYAAILADSKHIPFAGAEPSEKEILAQFMKSEYSVNDLIGFYVVRQFPQWVIQGRLKNERVEVIVSKFIKHVCSDFGLQESQCFNFSQFKDWYLKTNRKVFGREFNGEEAAPLADGRYITQQISAVVGKIRDQAILKKIEFGIRQYQNVLIVYGGSHLMTQLPALEDSFGPPKFFQ